MGAKAISGATLSCRRGVNGIENAPSLKTEFPIKDVILILPRNEQLSSIFSNENHIGGHSTKKPSCCICLE